MMKSERTVTGTGHHESIQDNPLSRNDMGQKTLVTQDVPSAQPQGLESSKPGKAGRDKVEYRVDLCFFSFLGALFSCVPDLCECAA